jgi:magnesium transporter
VNIAAWTGSKLRTDITLVQLPRALAAPKGAVWIDLVDPSRDELEKLADILHLHHLIVEDILERNERAKIVVSDEDVHIVMFSLALVDRHLEESEIDFVLGRRFLLSAHLADWDPQRSHELRGGLGPILAKGADFALWAIVDDLVDAYFPLFDQVDEEIAGLEDLILGRTHDSTVKRIFDLKRDLLTIRRVTSPQREVFNQLTNRELAFVRPEHIVYFRDVYDHLIRLTDELDSFRDRLTGALDAYLSVVNNNLAEIAKRLTAVTVILATIGAIGGIFGMSEAGPALAGLEMAGFWVITVASVALGAVLIVYLRRIGWL